MVFKKNSDFDGLLKKLDFTRLWWTFKWFFSFKKSLPTSWDFYGFSFFISFIFLHLPYLLPLSRMSLYLCMFLMYLHLFHFHILLYHPYFSWCKKQNVIDKLSSYNFRHFDNTVSWMPNILWMKNSIITIYVTLWNPCNLQLNFF